MDAKQILEQFHDYLAPKLDTYEQAIYLYVLRHSRLQGGDEVVVGFKSARRRIALGIGEKGKPMAEGTCYDKLRSLQSKGCIQVVSSERDGNVEIYTLGTNGTLTRLTNDSGKDAWPAWSPDGTRIAYTSVRGNASEVSVINADGTGKKDLTTSPAHDFKPAWTTVRR